MSHLLAHVLDRYEYEHRCHWETLSTIYFDYEYVWLEWSRERLERYSSGEYAANEAEREQPFWTTEADDILRKVAPSGNLYTTGVISNSAHRQSFHRPY